MKMVVEREFFCHTGWTNMSFYKQKKFWIILVVLALGGLWYWRNKTANAGPFYDTTPVVKQELKQTVEITGQVAPRDRIDLSFKASGRLTKINVSVGQEVKAGEVLAELDGRDLALSAQRANASVALIQAQLNVKLAGETKESIRVAQSAVDQAQVAYDKAVADLARSQVAIDDETQVSETAQSVRNAYDSLRNALQTALGSIQSSLADGDAIIGVDNSAANDAYENVLGVNERPSLVSARTITYGTARSAQTLAVSAVSGLVHTSPRTSILSASYTVQDALTKTQSYLDDVQRVLEGTITSPNFTATELATKKTTIDGDRVAVSAQLASVITARQTATTSETTRLTTIRTNEASVATTKSALDSAKATLELKKSPVRDVDLQPLRAQLLDAQTAYAQAVERLNDVKIVAPVDGTITAVIPAIGEQVAMTTPAIGMIGHELYQVEALVPESDIAKVKKDQRATLTLDAFGDSVVFEGVVKDEEPDQTKVQDAVYYKTHVTFSTGDKDVKPGMTANVTIHTALQSGVLVIPSRALREENGKRFVRVFVNGVATQTEVTTGLRGDDGLVEVQTGVKEGDQVVTGELTASEYKAKLAEQTKK